MKYCAIEASFWFFRFCAQTPYYEMLCYVFLQLNAILLELVTVSFSFVGYLLGYLFCPNMRPVTYMKMRSFLQLCVLFEGIGVISFTESNIFSNEVLWLPLNVTGE